MLTIIPNVSFFQSSRSKDVYQKWNLRNKGSYLNILDQKTGAKAIHPKLTSGLEDAAHSLSQVKYWTRKFKNGDIGWLDDRRSGPAVSGLGTVLETFLM
jgi:hypothetical protein